MTTLYEHIECDKEKHCGQCVVDTRWRAELESLYGTKIVCPLGKKLEGETPEPPAAPMKPSPPPSPPVDPAKAGPMEGETHNQYRARVAAAVEAARVATAYVPRFTPLPGDRLADLFKRAGIKQTQSCGCEARRVQYNNLWIELEKEMPEANQKRLMRTYLKRHGAGIAKDLIAEAIKQGIVISPLKGWRFVAGLLGGGHHE